MMRAVWLLWAVLWLSASAALPKPIADMLVRNKIDPSTVSIVIEDLKSGTVIASQSPTQSRVPASVMKILTTYSALTDLGTSFRWPTRFYYTGAFHKGTIRGDIVVEAFGDPTLSSTDLYRIAKRLRRLGVRRIRGDMVIDRSFFDNTDKVTSGFDRNRYSEYNAMPDAMMLNDHMSRFVVKPQGGKIVAQKLIPNDAYDLVNYLKPTDAACRGKNAWPYVGVTTQNGRAIVTLRGTISTRCPRRTISKLLTHPYESFYHAFAYALKRAGIAFEGRMVLGRVPANARALLVHRSAPLLRIVAKTNKKSNNLYARHIFLLLGAQH
jgi:D-alanyl-D-alanine carboxypeptidase/D-alanyl-D-alanine-endopeptidase (penicillin-binding protein 4)